MLKLLLVAGTLLGPALAQITTRVECDPTDQTIYDFGAPSIFGNETIQFADFAGKVGSEAFIV